MDHDDDITVLPGTENMEMPFSGNILEDYGNNFYIGSLRPDGQGSLHALQMAYNDLKLRYNEQSNKIDVLTRTLRDMETGRFMRQTVNPSMYGAAAHAEGEAAAAMATPSPGIQTDPYSPQLRANFGYAESLQRQIYKLTSNYESKEKEMQEKYSDLYSKYKKLQSEVDELQRNNHQLQTALQNLQQKCDNLNASKNREIETLLSKCQLLEEQQDMQKEGSRTAPQDQERLQDKHILALLNEQSLFISELNKKVKEQNEVIMKQTQMLKEIKISKESKTTNAKINRKADGASMRYYPKEGQRDSNAQNSAFQSDSDSSSAKNVQDSSDSSKKVNHVSTDRMGSPKFRKNEEAREKFLQKDLLIDNSERQNMSKGPKRTAEAKNQLSVADLKDNAQFSKTARVLSPPGQYEPFSPRRPVGELTRGEATDNRFDFNRRLPGAGQESICNPDENSPENFAVDLRSRRTRPIESDHSAASVLSPRDIVQQPMSPRNSYLHQDSDDQGYEDRPLSTGFGDMTLGAGRLTDQTLNLGNTLYRNESPTSSQREEHRGIQVSNNTIDGHKTQTPRKNNDYENINNFTVKRESNYVNAGGPTRQLDTRSAEVSPASNSSGQTQICPVCKNNFPQMSLFEFQQHAFDCVDNTESEDEENLQTLRVESGSKECPVCNAIFPKELPQEEYVRHVQEHFGDEPIVDDFEVLK